MEELNLQMFSWIDMDTFKMQLIEFQGSSISKQKFVDLRVELEKIERKRLADWRTNTNYCQFRIPFLKTFSCLKNFATALLSMLSSTYAFESLFSTMNLIKSRNRRRLTDETSSSCVVIHTSSR